MSAPAVHDGPPWILGYRGAPREAPENTLASLRRAQELELDGLAYDVRACGGGDLVLIADDTLERTTDARGLVAHRSLRELYGIDAGGWFAKRFAGEPIATLEEALALDAEPGEALQHLIVLHEAAPLAELARIVRGAGRKLSVRVASASRAVCVEARDLELEALYLVDRPSDDARRFVRDERLTAIGARVSGWPIEDREPWPCERWSFALDEPAELLRACRAPLNAIATTEPARARAVRALARLAPNDTGPYPLVAPELAIEPSLGLPTQAAWCGAWELVGRVRNPFAARTRVALDVVVRRGAFDAQGLPAAVELQPGEEREVAFRLSGGSWSPGGDPLLVARFMTGDGMTLELDATLHRVRKLVARDMALRLELLRERPGATPVATVHVRRRGRDLLVAIENAGEIVDARIVVELDGCAHRGARGVRVRLPADFDRRREGVTFAVAIEGRVHDQRGWRSALARWSGGWPSELDAGASGRVFSASVR